MKLMLLFCFFLSCHPSFAVQFRCNELSLALASYDAKNYKSDNGVSLIYTVDTFKSPGVEARPRIIINKGAPVPIDNDITDINAPAINSGITKPDVAK